MSERPTFNPEEVSNKEQEKAKEARVLQIRELVEKLAKEHEVLPYFPMNTEAYNNTKKDEKDHPEILHFMSPIDDKLKRMQEQGIKIVLSDKNPQSGNVFVLPAESTDILADSIVLKFIDFDDTIPETLKELLALKLNKSV